MKIIHTSDWHLGRPLYGQRRAREEEQFLSWLLELLTAREVEALLISGDVFDNGAPGHQAQELYYGFLGRVLGTNCKNVVITAGNHDSPSFLEAPKSLLRGLNIRVVGAASENAGDEVLVLENHLNEPELIVAAVPYLRDKDLRLAKIGENTLDKEANLILGLKDHYDKVRAAAADRRREVGRNLPLVVMGHLFAAGGQVLEGDGTRELYLGSLGQAPCSIFPPETDYLALGHLHQAQKVNNRETWRYSGSPLALNFSDRPLTKSLCLVDFAGDDPLVELIEVPVFQPLRRLRGNGAELMKQLAALAEPRAWLEIIYEGYEVEPGLKDDLEELARKKQVSILSFIKKRPGQSLARVENLAQEQLARLSPEQVFKLCLDEHQVPDEQRRRLTETYLEALRDILEVA